VTKVDDRRINFTVRATDEEEEIGYGTHERALITLARIAKRLAAKQR